jgi:hypothetical protein
MSTLTDVVVDTAIYEKIVSEVVNFGEKSFEYMENMVDEPSAPPLPSYESMENMMDEPSAPPLPSYESQKYHFFSRFLSCFYHHHHHYHHHHK